MTVYGFVGIDIAKDTFTAAFLRVDALQGHILSEQVADFPYTQEGWQHFLQTWQTFQADRWWVGLEASGPYSALLETHLSRLTQPAFTLHRLSPAQVRDFARSRSRRRAKTDRLDARTLAHFLRQQVTTQALSPAQEAPPGPGCPAQAGPGILWPPRPGAGPRAPGTVGPVARTGGAPGSRAHPAHRSRFASRLGRHG